MFDDIIHGPVKADKDTKLYVCKYANQCIDHPYCMHKLPHDKMELGRPDQEDPDDCSLIPCNHPKFKDAKCIPCN